MERPGQAATVLHRAATRANRGQQREQHSPGKGDGGRWAVDRLLGRVLGTVLPVVLRPLLGTVLPAQHGAWSVKIAIDDLQLLKN